MTHQSKQIQTWGGYQANISILRIVATICVIWLHTCSTLAENVDVFLMTEMQFKFFNASYQMMDWAVPVFFMITGSLLLNPGKKITASDCIWKYGQRIILALFFFGIPFAVLKLVMETGGLSVKIIPLSVKAVLENQWLAHLWYLYTLIGIYLILPVLRWFVAKAEDAEVKLVIVSLLVLDFIVPLLKNVAGLSIAFNLPLKYPILYVLLGWYLGKCDLKKYRVTCIAIGTVIMSIIWLLNYTIPNASDWTSYDSPLILSLAALIFVIFKNITVKGSERLWQADRLCFAVYLIHPVFIQFTYRFLKITPAQFKGLYLIATIGFFVLFTISAFIGAFILNQIKPLKKYVI